MFVQLTVNKENEENKIVATGKKQSLAKAKSPSKQQRQSLLTTKPRIMRINNSVNMVNTRSNKEQTTKEKLTRQNSAPITEVHLERPEQSIDEVGRKTTESTPMPNAEVQGTKTIELSPISNGNEVTGNTPETIKDDS